MKSISKKILGVFAAFSLLTVVSGVASAKTMKVELLNGNKAETKVQDMVEVKYRYKDFVKKEKNNKLPLTAIGFANYINTKKALKEVGSNLTDSVKSSLFLEFFRNAFVEYGNIRVDGMEKKEANKFKEALKKAFKKEITKEEFKKAKEEVNAFYNKEVDFAAGNEALQENVKEEGNSAMNFNNLDKVNELSKKFVVEKVEGKANPVLDLSKALKDGLITKQELK